MTIVTKPLTSEKKPAAAGDNIIEPLVFVKDGKKIDIETGKGGGLSAEEANNLNERYHYILRNRAAKVSSATTLCLLITALLIMTVGLFGGLYIYKQMSRAKLQKYRGWCNVPYYSGMTQNNNELAEPLSQILSGRRKIDNDGLSYSFGDDPDSDSAQLASFFREELELDLDDELYSKIEVPDFKNGRMGRFIHEFDSNKTAIVDITGNRCFIMPLDREHILPPKSMFDMLQKMWQGYYSVNTNQVRQNMKVVEPALNEEELAELGNYIQQECGDKNTYRLEKSTDRIVKRSAEEGGLPFAEFTGNNIVLYNIVNLDQLKKE